jgi:hypothetical protein
MSKQDESTRDDTVASRRSRQASLQALLFTGAVLATTLLTLAAAEPKTPPFRGE